MFFGNEKTNYKLTNSNKTLENFTFKIGKIFKKNDLLPIFYFVSKLLHDFGAKHEFNCYLISFKASNLAKAVRSSTVVIFHEFLGTCFDVKNSKIFKFFRMAQNNILFPSFVCGSEARWSRFLERAAGSAAGCGLESY
jgi:hypothetical protein